MANSELNKISLWFRANKHSLNVDKTNFIVFKTPEKKVHTDLPNIDSTQIEEVTQMPFLGVVFDQRLSWKPHISYLATKIAKSAGIIYKCKFYLPKSVTLL